MKSINRLLQSLNGYLPGNKARKNCFAQMLLGTISTKTVNLQEIALACPGQAESVQGIDVYKDFLHFFKMSIGVL
ncbi:MAG: hypothetical protein K0Q74_758 [Gammaproteobacteria bacterium]|jgi:hypothetical protein|nr:hypothetical protein [Gammaproteobacteria bacterium]